MGGRLTVGFEALTFERCWSSRRQSTATRAAGAMRPVVTAGGRGANGVSVDWSTNVP